jgi:hypothetical protein
MQFKTCRQHAATCFRLAIDAGDPEISQKLVAIAGEWLAQAAQAEFENLERSSISPAPGDGLPITRRGGVGPVQILPVLKVKRPFLHGAAMAFCQRQDS